jgi:hypothetical protein
MFVEISEETTDILSMQVVKVISNYDSDTKVVELSADNTNTNFGGLLRGRKPNVLTKIKSQVNINIIGFGRSAHIIYNCAKPAFDSMPVDIEIYVMKILGYTVHVESLNISVTSPDKSISKY